MRLEEAIPDTDVFYISRINTEVSSEVDTDPRQAENGIYVRMALLAMVLGKCSSFFPELFRQSTNFFHVFFKIELNHTRKRKISNMLRILNNFRTRY